MLLFLVTKGFVADRPNYYLFGTTFKNNLRFFYGFMKTIFQTVNDTNIPKKGF